MKHPFMKFYVRDWQADPELRMCSLEARGLWIELLCIMHNAKRRGFLETPQGVQLDDEQTSRLIGAFKDDLYRCKSELLLHGIPSVEEETGIWYCRRMVKEALKAQKCSDAGRSGGGNPLLNKENKEDIPEARSHISLKDTFKGASASSILMVEEILNCRPELRRIRPEEFFSIINNSKANPRQAENHREFIAEMVNSLKVPNNPARVYAGFMNSTGKPKQAGKQSTPSEKTEWDKLIKRGCIVC